MLNFEKLINLSKNPHKFLKSRIEEIKPLKEIYHLNDFEAKVLALLLVEHLKNRRFRGIDIDFLVDNENIYIGSKEHIEILKTLDSLESKNLIVKSKDDISIREDVFNKIILQKDEFERVNFEDIYSVLEYFNDLYDKREEEKITLNSFISKIKELSNRIKIKSLKNLIVKYDWIEKALILKLIVERIKGNEGYYASTFIGDIVDTLSEVTQFMQKVYSEELRSIKDKNIILNEGGRYRKDPYLEINEKAFYSIFGEKKKKKREVVTHFCKYVPYKKIEQEIFLDENIKKDIDLIANAINKKNFKKIKKDLKKHNLSSGIVALFYGYPGTGKTASAYYLVKVSKRDILHVDISSIRDKFVGESEKRLKAIFDVYRRAKETLKYEPILLFNEADALIGKRIETADSVDIMNNTMQNILLEELEKFDGIFIATTNLIENMDSAFNRRFLFKVEYQKPSFEIRKRIWQNKIDLPFIDEVAKFELTGGQIENITRKVLLDSILYQKEIKKEDVLRFIEDEIKFKESVEVGFKGY